jgi:hypothetical protein
VGAAPSAFGLSKSAQQNQAVGERTTGDSRRAHDNRPRVGRLVDRFLYLTAAAATALLLGLVARDDVGMPAEMVRTEALSAAGLLFAAVAGGSLLKRKK